MEPICDLILPCRDEGPALRVLLPTVPDSFAVTVVDNGSRDGTAQIASELGAEVVQEPVPGYGAAVHAGLLAATRDYVAFMDGDGSFAPAALLPMLEHVCLGRTDLAVGRRRPVSGGVWPWHARAGNRLIVLWLRHSIALPTSDLAPVRVCRRADLLALDVRDRRFGYPVELLQKATLAGWHITEHDVDYHPRAPGTRSKVSGSLTGTVRTIFDFWKALRSREEG